MKKGIKAVMSYQASDGKIFSGSNAIRDAQSYQKKLNLKSGLDEFNEFLRQLFNIKTGQEERIFCKEIGSEVNICQETNDEDFKEEVSTLILDLFTFMGQDKWLEIHSFLAKKSRRTRTRSK